MSNVINLQDYKTYKVFLVYGADDSECLFNVKADTLQGAIAQAKDILEARGLNRDEAQDLLDHNVGMDYFMTIEEGEFEEVIFGKNYFNKGTLN
jgi:hypothetical protein